MLKHIPDVILFYKYQISYSHIIWGPQLPVYVLGKILLYLRQLLFSCHNSIHEIATLIFIQCTVHTASMNPPGQWHYKASKKWFIDDSTSKTKKKSTLKLKKSTFEKPKSNLEALKSTSKIKINLRKQEHQLWNPNKSTLEKKKKHVQVKTMSDGLCKSLSYAGRITWDIWDLVCR